MKGQDEIFFFCWVLSSLGQCVSSLASGISTSYTNVVLARRDAYLQTSKIPVNAKSALRVLPLSTSLFGPQVADILHQVSERARDSAFLGPPRATATHSRGTPLGRGKRRFGQRDALSPRRKRVRFGEPSRSASSSKEREPARKPWGRGRGKPLPPQ